MPNRNRRSQNTRRWRRLEWNDQTGGFSTEPTPEPPNPNPVEEPVFEPEPETVEVTAEAVPLPQDFCVVVEAEAHVPETRVQLVSNPEQKKKVQELAKQKQELERKVIVWAQRCDQQNDVIERAIEDRKQVKKMIQDQNDEDQRFKEDVRAVMEIEKVFFRMLSAKGRIMGNIGIAIIFKHGGGLRPRPTFVCKEIETLPDDPGGVNMYNMMKDEEKETGFIQMRLGAWINLQPAYKYFLADWNNYKWFLPNITCGLKKKMSKMRWGVRELEAFGKYTCDVMDSKTHHGPEEVFGIIAEERLTEKDSLEGSFSGTGFEDGKNLWDYYRSVLEEKQVKQIGAKYDEYDEDASAEENNRWERAKNSIINI